MSPVVSLLHQVNRMSRVRKQWWIDLLAVVLCTIRLICLMLNGGLMTATMIWDGHPIADSCSTAVQ